MPLYMYQLSYTPEAVAALVREPQDRAEGAPGPFAVDFEEVLEGGRTETFAYSLFKSA